MLVHHVSLEHKRYDQHNHEGGTLCDRRLTYVKEQVRNAYR